MNLTAILLAAGQGKRLKSKTSKPLIKINKKEALLFSLETFNRHPSVNGIIVVANRRNISPIKALLKKKRFNKLKRIVLGGRRRQDSVNCGLRILPPECDYVLIHDAARPFVSREIISRTVKQARISQAAIAGVPVKYTIKKVKAQSSKVKGNKTVKETLKRDELWEAQTPQVFRKDVLLQAYQKFGKEDVTDDASLVEKLGAKVSVVFGSYANIKLTTLGDVPQGDTLKAGGRSPRGHPACL